MKRLTAILLFTTGTLFAQYYGERTTEQSFESSSLFFNSHYLNTYGIYKFKDAAVGLIDDPFLNSYLNPAFIPDLGDKEFLLHIDFRGDRTKPEVLKTYVQPIDYLASSIYRESYIDPRWFSKTRTEPEPVVSIGFLMYPEGRFNKNFYIGGSYQLILADESFYEMPYSIYNKNIYYDSFNSRISSEALSIDYSASTDEMLNEAHMLSLFSGYKFSEKMSAGIFLNSVILSRDGAFGNNGIYYSYPYSNALLSERDQSYGHLDVAAGINYKTSNNFLAGLKLGLLTGNAEQTFLSESNYYYKSNEPGESDTWDYNYSNYLKEQNWDQDGNTFYGSLNLQKQFTTGSSINMYYRFTTSDVSSTTSSTIDDTLNYSYKYYDSYTNKYNISESSSSLHDQRSGNGTRDTKRHEFMFNVNWLVSDAVNIYSALYVKRENYSIEISEPVTANRFSYSYNETYPDNIINVYNNSSSEKKTMNWSYEAKIWTLQIPVLVNVEVNRYWGFMAGINRILDAWNVDDITTAQISTRQKVSNGVETNESNIIEKYRQPDKRITEDKFDIIASFHGNITDELKVRLILNPDFDNEFSIEQWWLSFNAGF